MKKFWKSLALLLCLLAGFGFVVTGCSDGDDGNGGDTAKIALSKEAVTLQPGGSVTLTLNKGSTPITSGVTWLVDDPTVANVNASDTCVATVSPKDGVSSGSTNLIATYESKKYTAKITVSDISLPITIEFSSSFVNDEFGALTPSQSKETYADSGLNTWDTGTAEVRTTTGMYVLANASGLIKNPREGDKFITYYYGSGGSAAAAVGGTLPAAGLKSYLAFSAAQVKTDKASVKVTINAHGVDYDHAKDAAEAGKYGTIGIVDSSNNKVLAISETLTAEAKDYVFYVKPSTRLVITNVGKDGTSISFNKMTLEASDNAVTATGSIAVESITLNTATLSGKAGGSAGLTATVLPATATGVSLTWASSDPSVAKVTPAENTLTAAVEYVAAGSATITVSMGSVKQEAAVTVTAAGKPITAIGISGNAAIDLFNNDNPTTTLTATVTPADTDVTSLLWSSSDPAIAKVASASTNITSGTSSVVVTAAGKVGTAKITAKAGSVEKTFDVVVSASGASWKTYDINAITKADSDATANDDGTISWKGITNNGSGWMMTSDSTEITVKVGSAAVVTFETYPDSKYAKPITVKDSNNNVLVNSVTSYGIANTKSRRDVAFIYKGTTAEILTITIGSGSFFDTITVANGSEAKNGAGLVVVDSNCATEIVKGDSKTYTASVTGKYINTDENAYTPGTITWNVTGSENASITSEGILTVNDLTVDATLKIIATCDGVSSDDYTVSASATAKTEYDLVTWEAVNFPGTATSDGSANADLGGATIVIGGSATTYVQSQNIVVNVGGTLRIPVSSGSVISLTHNWNAIYTLGGTTCKGSATYTATSAGYVELVAINGNGGGGDNKPTYLTKITVSNYKTTDTFTSVATGSVTSGATE